MFRHIYITIDGVGSGRLLHFSNETETLVQPLSCLTNHFIPFFHPITALSDLLLGLFLFIKSPFPHCASCLSHKNPLPPQLHLYHSRLLTEAVSDVFLQSAPRGSAERS